MDTKKYEGAKVYHDKKPAAYRSETVVAIDWAPLAPNHDPESPLGQLWKILRGPDYPHGYKKSSSKFEEDKVRGISSETELQSDLGIHDTKED